MTAAIPADFRGGQRRRAGRPARLAVVTVCLAVLVFIWGRLRSSARRITFGIFALSLALAPMPLASALDQQAISDAEFAQHAALAAQEAADHGHSHEFDDEHDQSRGHLHGHDPADHSHQFAFFPNTLHQWGLPAAPRWPSLLTGQPDPATIFGIDRPPKQTMYV